MSKKSTDMHAVGQQEAAESRNAGFLGEAWNQITGGPCYNPPSNSAEREQYYAGVENAGNNPPRK